MEEDKKVDRLNNIIERLEEVLEKQITKFEEHPLRVTIICVALFFIVKKVYRMIKES